METMEDLEGQLYIEGCDPAQKWNLRFERLDLKNFRNHEELHLEFRPVTLITGPNGSGKSSVQMALEWLLSGRCAVTNERGQGPVGREGLEPSVSATLPGGATISRCGNRLACSWAPGAKHPETELARGIGCTSDRARLALQVGRFFRIDADERKALLYDLLDLHVKPEEVEELLRAEGAPLRLLVDLVGRGNLAQLSFVHKKLYDRRRDVNREADIWTKSIRVAEEQNAEGEACWESEEAIQVLLDEDKALMARERQLIADEQSAKAKLEEMRRKLADLQSQAEVWANCRECGFPSPARAQLETEGGLLKAGVAKVEGELPSYLESLQCESEQIALRRGVLKGRIHSGTTLRESMTNLNANREKLKRLRDESEKLSLLLTYFSEGTTGIMHRKIAPRIAQFEADLNAIGSAWGLEFSYEGVTKPAIRQYSTNWVPYEGLSDGQQILASLAHQVVFAQKYRLGVVCLDRIEALDTANRNRLFEICAGLVGNPESGVLQVLLFGTIETTPDFRNSLADWCKHYEFGDHAVNYVGF